jgi:enoyl-CoA hydratase
MSYQLIQVRTEADKVGIITLNRPKQLNALNSELMVEMGTALKLFDADPHIGCIILTGNEKAFAAGADVLVIGNAFFKHKIKDYATLCAHYKNLCESKLT